MRAEDSVNEHRAAFRHYRGSNGASITLQDTLPLPTASSWQRFKNHFAAENLIVAGREVRGWVISQPLALFMAGLIATAFAYQYRVFSSEMQTQHDTMIRLETKLDERTAHETEYRGEAKRAMELQQVYINDLNKQLNAIRYVLTPQQSRALKEHPSQEN